MIDAFRLQVSADRSLAWKEGGSVRHIVATIAADRAGDAVVTMPPVNLAIVVDASGSMQGEKIASAKRAALGVVERMGERDRLTVVSFASDVIVHLDRIEMSDAGRRSAREALRLLESRGNTNLSEGWLKGAELIASIGDDRAINRIILLSDGMANQGLTDRRELASYASGLAERGICTSTVGIGNGYELPLLRDIAEYGGGQLHDAERSEDLVDALVGELGEIADILAHKVTLTLAVSANASAKLIGSAPSTVSAGSFSVFLGSLRAGHSRTVVFQVRLSSGNTDEQVLFAISARGWSPSGDLLAAGPTEVPFTLVEGTRNNRQTRNAPAAMEVARAWHSEVMQKAADLNRSGDRYALMHYLDGELRFFGRYVEGLDDAKPFLAELMLIREQADRNWDERTRKEMELAGYHHATGKMDYRKRRPDEHWSDRISRER